VTPVTHKGEPVNIAKAALDLANDIDRYNVGDDSDILRVEIPVLDTDPLSWLSAQSSATRLYWRDRGAGLEIAGIGEAASSFSLKDLRYCVEALDPNCRYLGGFRFDPDRKHDSKWDTFQSVWFVLPAIELVVHEGKTTLACNIAVGSRESTERLKIALKAVAAQLPHASEPPRVVHRTENPTRDQWSEMVGRAFNQIKTGTLTKVVLARQATLELNAKIDPWSLLSKMKASGDDVCLFGFQPSESSAFIGATPERLFKRRGLKVETESLAGTRSRGWNPETDNDLGNDLLHSDKDRREQLMVTDFILESMRPIAAHIECDKSPSVRKLSRLQHLCTEIHATIGPITTNIDILKALHPTPAVAGVPRDRAIEIIQELEPFDRGWYAGPVGWMGANSAEFAVAIRSVLVRDNLLILTAGAGIVDGSTADTEWIEIENKLQSTLDMILPS
jgi:menaquinone-specific isochorismate synthase